MIKKICKLFGKKETKKEINKEIIDALIEWEQKKKEETSKKAISFKEALDLTGTPIVTLNQGQKKLNFILDTGSTSCVINKSVLSTIEHEKTDEKAKWHGIEGNPIVVDMCNITLTYKGHEFPYQYIEGDLDSCFEEMKKDTGVTVHGILGCSFFEQYKYVLDFAELIAYSKA